MGDADVERVKERTDIVALIGEHVRLKRAGSSFKGLCPFHQEKTPSFVVSPTRQMFHCFGCNESGDCFSWLMKREGMTFPEALRVLAQRAGIQLSFERAETREDRERLRATLATATDFYHAILLKTAEGREAREYLKHRGITEESITQWQLGYVPLVTTPLIEKASERGVTADDLRRAGIVAEGPRGFYERFYGRLLFPLTDAHGSVVAFAGRILHEDPREPAAKYVNSPETPLYTKSKILYGLDKGRDAIRREDLLIVVEGYTDVIASHQAGVGNVVATAGTALTEDHLRIMKRFTEHIAFAFDADAAGDQATRRAIDLAVAVGSDVSIVVLPAGKDPADLAIRDPAAWQRVIAERKGVFAFLLERALNAHDPTDTAGKNAIARDLLPLLARVPDAVVRGDYLQRLATSLRIEPKYLHEDLERVRGTAAVGQGAIRTEETAVSPPYGSPPDAAIRREERLLTLFLAFPVTFPGAAEHLPPAAFTGAHTRHLYEALLRWYHSRRAAGAPVDFSHVQDTLPEDLRRLVDVFQLAVEVEREEGLLSTPDRDARILLRDLLFAYLRRHLAEITRQLEVSPPERRSTLLADVARVTEELARAEHLTS